MAASYPTSKKIFTTKVDNVDDVMASHINEPQDEIMAIEDQLITSKLSTLGAPSGSQVLISVAGVPTWAAKAPDADKLDNLDSTYFMPVSYKDGWIPVTGTFSYASASTITVPSGAAAVYSLYDKVKFTQHGVTKYGYVYPTSDTLLTFYAGSDFSIENTSAYPITNAYYSHAASPVGFPQWFDYTPILTVSGGTAPTYATFINRYCMVGKMVTVYGQWYNGSGGTAGAGTNQIVITLPITAYQENIITGSGGLVNGSTFLAGLGIYLFGTYFAIMKTAAFVTGADQNDAYRELLFTFTYEAA